MVARRRDDDGRARTPSAVRRARCARSDGSSAGRRDGGDAGEWTRDGTRGRGAGAGAATRVRGDDEGAGERERGARGAATSAGIFGDARRSGDVRADDGRWI